MTTFRKPPPPKAPAPAVTPVVAKPGAKDEFDLFGFVLWTARRWWERNKHKPIGPAGQPGPADSTGTVTEQNRVNPSNVAAGVVVAMFVLPIVALFVIALALFAGYGGGGDNRLDCEAARQEVARRLGSGTLNERAVDRLANCR
jgi:hypothetical protein